MASYKRKRRERLDKRIKEEIIARGNKCHQCGQKHHPAAMDWHHIGQKSDSVASMITKNMSHKTILAEIAKCVLVCCLCHRLHHAGVIWIEPPEGQKYDPGQR